MLTIKHVYTDRTAKPKQTKMHYVSLMLPVGVCTTSSSDVDVSHPKFKTHRMTPRSDTGIARVCFPSCLKPMVRMHVPSLALISIPQNILFRSLNNRVAEKSPYPSTTQQVDISNRCTRRAVYHDI